MSLHGPDAIRARRRGGVVLALAACRLACGVCLASPLASLLGESGVGARAEGDRLLFEGGGYLLLEVARLQGPALLAAARGLLPLLTLGLLLTALGNAVLLVALSEPEERRARALLSDALARLPTLLFIGVLAGLAQAALLLFASLAADAVPSPPTRPVASSAGVLGVWLAAALVAGAVGGAADVAKASSVRARAGVAAALEHARRACFTRPLSALLGWLPYALLMIGSVAAAAAVTGWLDVSAPGAWRVAAVFIVHQLVVVGSVMLRAGWYARALRLVTSVPRPGLSATG